MTGEREHSAPYEIDVIWMTGEGVRFTVGGAIHPRP